MLHILMDSSVSTFCFLFGDISSVPMKNIILGCKTINQNVYEQNFLPNTKVLK